MKKRSLLRLALGLALAFSALPGLAQGSAGGYPDRPIKLIVPFPPGGPTDIVARPFAQALSQTLGQPVTIENRGGAGGSVGAAAVAKSAPDGYTLLLGTVGTEAINPALYPKLPYDPAKDLAPVAILAAAPVALVIHPSLPARNVAELLALAATQPVRFGTAGNGTPGHLTGDMFRSATGAQLVHVPYKGSAPAVQDLLGGHIDAMFDPLQSVLPHIKAGKLKALAISAAHPAKSLPEVPTFSQAGVKLETTAWWGVFAPAGTPPAVVDKLSRQLLRAQDSDEVRQLEALGIALLPGKSPDELGNFLKAEGSKWARAVKDSGARVD